MQSFAWFELFQFPFVALVFVCMYMCCIHSTPFEHSGTLAIIHGISVEEEFRSLSHVLVREPLDSFHSKEAVGIQHLLRCTNS